MNEHIPRSTSEISTDYGDILKIISKENNDWWHVKKMNGYSEIDGYVPTNSIHCKLNMIIDEITAYERIQISQSGDTSEITKYSKKKITSE